MKILIVSQYFWPENFRINELVLELRALGCEITVLTGKPNYPSGQIFPQFRKNPNDFSEYNGVQIIRVPILPRGRDKIRLVLNYLSFVVAGSILGPLLLRGKKFDEIFIFQTSPITAAIPAIIINFQKKARLSIWVLDLWPEALLAMRILKNGYAYTIFEKIVKWIYGSCDRIYISSQGFLPSVKKYVLNENKISYFPQWVESEYIEEICDANNASKLICGKNFNIVYAGNLGESQDFESIIMAAEILKETGILIYLIGDGRVRDWLVEEISRRKLTKTVILLGAYPSNFMKSLYAQASALLVSLRHGPVFSTALPGKIQTYLSVGKPIIGMLDGEGARVLKESGSALVVPAGNYIDLASNIILLRNMSPDQRNQMGFLGVEYAEKHFNKKYLIKSLISDMKSICARSDHQ
jgi:colanic acid biosynthesis glycosyl transferase WcaI